MIANLGQSRAGGGLDLYCIIRVEIGRLLGLYTVMLNLCELLKIDLQYLCGLD